LAALQPPAKSSGFGDHVEVLIALDSFVDKEDREWRRYLIATVRFSIWGSLPAGKIDIDKAEWRTHVLTARLAVVGTSQVNEPTRWPDHRPNDRLSIVDRTIPGHCARTGANVDLEDKGEEAEDHVRREKRAFELPEKRVHGAFLPAP
jgi:hypothetical protein